MFKAFTALNFAMLSEVSCNVVHASPAVFCASHVCSRIAHIANSANNLSLGTTDLLVHAVRDAWHLRNATVDGAWLLGPLGLAHALPPSTAEEHPHQQTQACTCHCRLPERKEHPHRQTRLAHATAVLDAAHRRRYSRPFRSMSSIVPGVLGLLGIARGKVRQASPPANPSRRRGPLRSGAASDAPLRESGRWLVPRSGKFLCGQTRDVRKARNTPQTQNVKGGMGHQEICFASTTRPLSLQNKAHVLANGVARRWPGGHWRHVCNKRSGSRGLDTGSKCRACNCCCWGHEFDWSRCRIFRRSWNKD